MMNALRSLRYKIFGDWHDKRERKKRIKLLIAIVAASISLIIFASVILFVAGVIFATGFDLVSMIYILAGIVLVPAGIYFLVRQRSKFVQFCLVYKNQKMEKHTPKVMRVSLIKFFAVILVMVTASHGVIAVLILPLYAVAAHGAFKYAKLWRYHGYSVLLLVGMTALVIAGSVIIAPFIRDGIGFLWGLIA